MIRYRDGVGWAQVFVAMVFAGLAVLAVCTVKVVRAVQILGRELDRARRRLEPERSALKGELRRLRRTREPDHVDDGVRST
ncbi:hypothetical protein Tcur_2318 [Thermomonospora curvata DSM 43183]|uniref:Secreted protein n=1 Tax=Thermomonospora curvata (strain ATCC 19995 / DSM 43183 / JCM 3096 / KCTC 9072 / NBRC 15933 / NCIMB 10081 / Henssen B9) TaxID=471852 RepID=D1A2T6_THECD|nr:hypothetical protein Tcur_2318 [Thermomonospora curvata DSM 43183]PKK14166.1 MAG: hypothetical protein BUE48_011340 [Thermomonospora sp. CIF 1]